MKAFITGSAGFIGYHLCKRLLDEGWDVIGLDAMTDYYDVNLKERRHAILKKSSRFREVNARIETPRVLMKLLAKTKPDIVVNLAAQAGEVFNR